MEDLVSMYTYFILEKCLKHDMHASLKYRLILKITKIKPIMSTEMKHMLPCNLL